MRRLTKLVLLVVAAVPARGQTVAITGGRVLPVSGAPIERGTVLIRDGRIVAVGADLAIPADVQRVDATGKVVTPGLVNAATALSIVDIGAVAATRNVSARGRDGIAAAFTVWDGLNPASVLLAPPERRRVSAAGSAVEAVRSLVRNRRPDSRHHTRLRIPRHFVAGP